MTPRGVKDLLEKSGDDLPHDVADVLRKNGWIPQISARYIDVASGKTREIDVIARKVIAVGQGTDLEERIVLRLFIECKYLEGDYLLRFVDKDERKARELVRDNRLLQQASIDIARHHYLSGMEVAKTWIGKGRDDFYDAWVQSLHSMIYFSSNHNEGRGYVVDFPLVVVGSFENLYRREKTEQGYSPITKGFQLEVDYSYPLKETTQERTFFIDFIPFEGLSDFLNFSLTTDASILEEALSSELNRRAFQRYQANQRRSQSGDAYWV